MWIDARDVLNDSVRCGQLWGPEVKLFLAKLIKTDPTFIYEYSYNQVLIYFLKQDNTPYGKLLANSKITSQMALTMYEDFVEFCFPSFYMTIESFKLYCTKLGFTKTLIGNRFGALFRAVTFKKNDYIDWQEFLIALVCLEPNTEHSEVRQEMLFRFYNNDGQGQLDFSELVAMVKDIHPDISDEGIANEILRPVIKTCKFKDTKLSFEDFKRAIQSEKFSGIEKLCRSPTLLISRIISDVNQRRESQNSNKCIKVKRRNRGICHGCRAQNLEYCLNSVIFDSTGHCVTPTRISNLGKDLMQST